MKQCVITWKGPSGLEWSDAYDDMDLFNLRVINLVMNNTAFTVTYQ